MGPPSAASEEVETEPTPPSPPTAVTSEAISESEIRVGWTPGDDNGSPINGYKILMRTNQTGHHVSGLYYAYTN